MAHSDQGKQWYLAVGERSIGPLTTELVVRGIRSGKVPTTAWACQVGATQWSAISSFDEFQGAMVAPDQNSDPQTVSPSERPRYGRSPFGMSSADALSVGDPALDAAPSSVMPAAVGFDRPSQSEDHECVDPTSLLPYERVDAEALPAEVLYANAESERSSLQFTTSADAILGSSYAVPNGSDAGLPGLSLDESLDDEDPGRACVSAHQDDLAIEITFDEAHEGSINWLERFQSYFLVGTEIELPDEDQLLRSMRETPHHVFLHDEALWNLALCLAFGSDEVARSSAVTFFDAIGGDRGAERVEWICRTLLSKGFMPSGIPRCDGMRGIDVLRMACPLELTYVIEREAVD